jgi:acyl-CoA dehydrogenase
MFTMMNNARLSVAAQGVGLAEAALQHALAYAEGGTRGRRRCRPTGRSSTTPTSAGCWQPRGPRSSPPARSALSCAKAIDMATATGSPEWQARAAFLTPIAKAYGTDVACEVTGMGVQVHGGMGFIEETGAAQYLRDARILPIYEGTNGIQAMDLVGRKLADGGEAAFRLIDEIQRGAEAGPRAAARSGGRGLAGGRGAARGDRGVLALP